MPVVAAAIIAAAGTATAAGLQYKAAKNAAKTQETAADKALALEKTTSEQNLDFAKAGAAQAQANLEAARKTLADTSKTQGDIYQQQVSNLSPFTSLGNSAAGTLGDMMGVPVSMPTSIPINAPAYAPLPSSTLGSIGAGNQWTPYRPGNAQGVIENPIGPPLTNPTRSVNASGSVATGTAVPRPADAVPTGATEVAPTGRLGDVGSPQATAQAQRGSSYTMQAPTGETMDVPAELVAHYRSRGAVVIGVAG